MSPAFAPARQDLHFEYLPATGISGACVRRRTRIAPGIAQSARQRGEVHRKWRREIPRRLLRADGRSTLRCEIEDSGVGIAPQDLDRLFEPFERSNEHRRRIEGTGLGLTITRRLLEAMGARLTVTSEPGAGSVFSFELELERARTACSDQRDQAHVSPAMPARGAACSSPTTSRPIARCWSNYWAISGFETSEAGNGAEALKAIAATPSGCIDHRPGNAGDGRPGGGAQPCGATRFAKDLPILAVSASASDYTREEAHQRGLQRLPAEAHPRGRAARSPRPLGRHRVDDCRRREPAVDQRGMIGRHRGMPIDVCGSGRALRSGDEGRSEGADLARRSRHACRSG